MFGWKLGLISRAGLLGTGLSFQTLALCIWQEKTNLYIFQCLRLPLFQEYCSTSYKYVVCKLMDTKPGCFLREKSYICANGIKKAMLLPHDTLWWAVSTSHWTTDPQLAQTQFFLANLVSVRFSNIRRHFLELCIADGFHNYVKLVALFFCSFEFLKLFLIFLIKYQC